MSSVAGSSGASGSKRPRVDDPGEFKEEGSSKNTRQKTGTPMKSLHPFFGPKTTSTFKWTAWIGGTCRYGINLTPIVSAKVAAFDIDGTLIKPKSGARFPKDAADWQWNIPGHEIPKKLKSLHEEGYAIVFVSNQVIVPSVGTNLAKRMSKNEKFANKLPLIAAQLPSIPFTVYAATEKDGYRKPMAGTWFHLEKIYREEGVEINLSESFYVGDAGGRPGDHNVSDRLYAMNIGIPFFTPEEYFLNKPPRSFALKGRFHPSTIPNDVEAPLSVSETAPIIPTNPVKPEIVIFVGFPAVGKSSFFRKHFAPVGYVHVNQDTVGTKNKCIKLIRESIAEGKSCVVDNTNRDLQTRSTYHALARELNVSIRAFYFKVPMELAHHINIYRAFGLSEAVKAQEPPRALIPLIAYTSFQNAFQMPTMEEGFSEVNTVNWVFEGSDEDRRRFNMYNNVL